MVPLSRASANDASNPIRFIDIRHPIDIFLGTGVGNHWPTGHIRPASEFNPAATAQN